MKTMLIDYDDSGKTRMISKKISKKMRSDSYKKKRSNNSAIRLSVGKDELGSYVECFVLFSFH